MGTNLGSGFDNRNDTNSLTSSLIGEFLVNDNLIILRYVKAVRHKRYVFF